MRIYIDEAGGFVVPKQPRPYSYSLVFSLVVPSAFEVELLYEYIRLRDEWPNQGIEVKGSEVNETQAAAVIDLVSRYDVFASYFAVDMNTHTDDVIDDFKLRQAQEITANLGPEHHPDIVSGMQSDANAMRKLSNQLFIQAILTIDLVLELLQEVPLYYSQRLPQELGRIEWVIDAKDDERTQMEELWTKYVLPFGESRFARTPVKALQGADYSFYHETYGVKSDDKKMRAHRQWLADNYGAPGPDDPRKALDLGRLLKGHSFVDSRNSLAVQLADTLGSILRRAYNDRLGYTGWGHFGKLLVRTNKNHTRIIQIGRPTNASTTLTGRPATVWRVLDERSKSMLVG